METTETSHDVGFRYRWLRKRFSHGEIYLIQNDPVSMILLCSDMDIIVDEIRSLSAALSRTHTNMALQIRRQLFLAT